MDAIAALVSVALTVAVNLGLPVVVLFIMGYLAYREGRRAGSGPSGGTGDGRRCWDRQRCPSSRREDCPAADNPQLPCWQAVKTARGRLRSQCVDCELFLAPSPRG